MVSLVGCAIRKVYLDSFDLTKGTIQKMKSSLALGAGSYFFESKEKFFL